MFSASNLFTHRYGEKDDDDDDSGDDDGQFGRYFSALNKIEEEAYLFLNGCAAFSLREAFRRLILREIRSSWKEKDGYISQHALVSEEEDVPVSKEQ